MPLKSKRPHQPAVTATTGHHAPASGWWRPDGDPEPFRYLQQGDIMPSLGGTQAIWKLVQELDPALMVRCGSRQRQLTGGRIFDPSVAPTTRMAKP
ncbi:hypothetical protein [Arthrobacter sp. SO3]|uniref:hypothetical protein n=1 Tax=Arthrobacter sp. SO3 TaxID=1897057 RepID=UPI001D000B0F|nr:hypothetical protein [Arthrobacter sp. SO3]MCB5291983.1 hypothetical protein [Arthrobacter sp. SO3]